MDSLLQSIISWLTDTATSAVNNTLGWVFTLWFDPGLNPPVGYTVSPTGSVSPAGAAAVSAAELAPGVATLLAWLKWGGACVCVVGLVLWAVQWAWQSRQGAGEGGGRLLLVAGGIVLVGGGCGLAGFLAQPVINGLSAGGTVGIMQRSTIMYAVVWIAASVIVCGIKMAMDGRGEPLRKLAGSFGNFVATSLCISAAVAIGLQIGDVLASTFLGIATDCGQDTGCMTQAVLGSHGTAWQTGASVGVLLAVFVVICVGMVGGLFQVVMFLFRGPMLVVTTSLAPIAASGTFFKMGEEWDGKLKGWLLAFLLYKPVAGFIYAVGILLMKMADYSSDQSISAPLTFIYGLVLLALGGLLLPVLLRLCAPHTSPNAGGSGAAQVIAAGLSMAMMMTMMRNATGSGSDGGSGSGSGSSSQPSGTSQPTGAQPQPSGGTPPPSTGTGAGTASAGAGAGAGAASAGGTAGAGSAGGAAAGGAAGGPAGLAVVAGAQAAGAVIQQASGAASDAAGDSDGGVQ